MEVIQNGWKMVNSKLSVNENTAKSYFENQKWFKCKEADLEKIMFLQREVFISILNHDLKIPTLAQIRALELLLDESEGHINDSQKEIINLTLSSCRYMYEMLSTLLASYKYENNDIILYFENTNLLRLIDSCFNKKEEALESKNIKIVMSTKEDFYTVFADRIQIKKAFDNIIDYIVSSADVNSEIKCELKKWNQKFVILISFESPYVSVEKLNNIFNMCIDSSENLDKVGSGLGLYLAKQIIDAHNGNLYAHNNGKIYCVVEMPCINEC